MIMIMCVSVCVCVCEYDVCLYLSVCAYVCVCVVCVCAHKHAMAGFWRSKTTLRNQLSPASLQYLGLYLRLSSLHTSSFIYPAILLAPFIF